MESINELKQIVKPIKPEQTAANAGSNPIKQVFFEDYKSYSTYYKASILYNTNFIRPQIYICRSYNTDIAIFNRMNGTLLLNIEWYNSSNTTAAQLDHFIFKYCFKPIRTIYLKESTFNELTAAFYCSDVGLYENKEYNIIKLYEHDKSIMETLKNPFLTLPEKLEELKPYVNLNIAAGREFKTTTERIFIYTASNSRSNIKFKVTRRFKKYKRGKNYHKKVTYEKLILPDEPNFYNDPRKQNDKKYFSSYDMGRGNRKEDYIL